MGTCLPPGRWLLTSSGRRRGFCGAPWRQIGDVVPLVPALADSVPQMVDQLVAVLARYDTLIADQVIEVPKVSCPPPLSPLWSYCSLYAAAGGTAGESADDPLLSQADR